MPENPIHIVMRRQRGVGLLLVIFLLALGVGAAIFGYVGGAQVKLAANRRTADVLAQTRAALINYAVTAPHNVASADGTTRPGELPCPDRNNDGYDNDGNCSVDTLGRVPWRTLGIPEPKDSSGETLWYAVAAPFRTAASNSTPINSDSTGTLAVYDVNGTSMLTGQAVAVLFAPGSILTTLGQNRDNPNSTASNYLETSNGRNNSLASGPFINGQNSDSFNDRVVFIVASDIIPGAEKQVAQAASNALIDFRVKSSCQCYPWAADFAGGGYDSATGINRGRLPLTALPEGWGTNGSVTLPAWFTANNWNRVIYYAVSKQNTEHAGAACTTCVATSLTLNISTNLSALFFTPGTVAVTGATRPSNNIGDYLKDAQNADGDEAFVTPTSTSIDRNRISTFISAASPP